MNRLTASHVYAMATKIEEQANQLGRSMRGLAHVAQRSPEMAYEQAVDSKFAEVGGYIRSIQDILRDMKPRMHELFAEE